MSPRSHHRPVRQWLYRTQRIASCAAVLAGGALAQQAAWIPVKAEVAQVLLERAFVASGVSGEPQRPWPWADMVPLARIEVPRLGESAIILSGASGQALAFGPTQVPTRDGVVLLAAHRDTHFAFIRDLREGDTVTLETVEGEQWRYRVRTFQTVRWDLFAISRNLPGDWLALVTCYPFDSEERGPLRRIAWAEREE